MSTPNPSDTQTDQSRVLEKIAEIVNASADGDYIYRGEPEYYEKVSSNLYREYPRVEGIPFDIAEAQKNILKEAKAYIGATDDIDETDNIGILTQLQHFGGKTNLIDFTEDYLIALFFACDGSHEKDGRVILLKRKSDDYEVREPQRKISRVEAQKSVFVEAPEGFIQPDLVVTIPVNLKMPMLNYLRKYHRISIETIYNDLHGFIRRSTYTEFLKGLTCHGKANQAETSEKKDEHLENAIRHYTEALKLKPDYVNAYNNRGIVYAKKGEFDTAIQDFNIAIELKPDYADAYYNRGIAYRANDDLDTAIQDYTKAIELKPDDAEAHYNRGIMWLHQHEWEKAKADLIEAQDKGFDIVAQFHKGYETIEVFEAALEVQVPEDIAALLRGD